MIIGKIEWHPATDAVDDGQTCMIDVGCGFVDLAIHEAGIWRWASSLKIIDREVLHWAEMPVGPSGLANANAGGGR